MLYWVTCSALSGTSVTWAAVTCCLWGLATKHYNQSSNFLCLVAVQKSAAKVGILDQPGVLLSQSQFFPPQSAKTVWYWDFDFLTVTVFCWRNIFCVGPGWRIIRIMGRSALLGHVVNTSPPRRAFVPVDQNFKITKLEIIQNCSSYAPYLQIKIKTLPKAQRTRGLSSYHKFKHKSWSNFIFRISTKPQLENISISIKT